MPDSTVARIANTQIKNHLGHKYLRGPILNCAQLNLVRTGSAGCQDSFVWILVLSFETYLLLQPRNPGLISLF